CSSLSSGATYSTLLVERENLIRLSQAGLANPIPVLKYLGGHRAEVDHLCRMVDSPRKIEERIYELSMKLVNAPGGQALDTMDYRRYRQIRDRQQKERY